MYSTCDSLSAGRNPEKYPKMECFAARGCASFPVAACGPRPPRPQCRVKVTYALSTGPSSSYRLAFHGTPKIFCLGRIRWLFFLWLALYPVEILASTNATAVSQPQTRHVTEMGRAGGHGAILLP